MRRNLKLSFSTILLVSATWSPLAARAADAPPPPAPEPPAAPNYRARGTCLDPQGPDPAGPPPAARFLGDAKAYVPFTRLVFNARCTLLEVPLSVAGRMEAVSSFPVDRYGNTFAPGLSLSPELRIGARFTTGRLWTRVSLLAEAEADLLTGVSSRGTALGGQGYPGSEGVGLELRKLHARASFAKILSLDVGAQTSHFGMGLVSNDGTHGWEPGSAAFSDPRSGDRVLRAELSTAPLSSAGIVLAVGADKVLGDDNLRAGDSARQLFGALVFGAGSPTSAGAYVVRRHQENAAARTTDVTVVDLTAKTRFKVPGGVLGLETEWAVIDGATQLGATPAFPTHDVLALGGAARVSFDAGAYGAVLDFLYASGDQNPYDRAQNGFQVDPNYAFGLLLFHQVVAAQSARTAATAADPQLVGAPAQDLERVPTRGSPTNTVALFPKLRVRPFAGFEVYGGPLFAFANVPSADVFNTQVSGGAPRSALGGDAGRYLGTELDLGVRYRMILRGSELTLGAEGGALAPGSAFLALDNTRMGPVAGGRGMLRYRF